MLKHHKVWLHCTLRSCCAEHSNMDTAAQSFHGDETEVTALQRYIIIRRRTISDQSFVTVSAF